jgi:hypothetical protein
MLLFTLLLLFIYVPAGAQTEKNNYKLPGNGLKQHDFVYVGEWDLLSPKAQKIFMVRDGKVVWEYTDLRRWSRLHTRSKYER